MTEMLKTKIMPGRQAERLAAELFSAGRESSAAKELPQQEKVIINQMPESSICSFLIAVLDQ